MKKSLLLLFLIFAIAKVSFGTHNRAGYITYSVVPGSGCLCYNFTLVTYTKRSSPADRPYLPIVWGDNTSDTAVARDIAYPQQIGNLDINVNVYYTTHCFPGPGTYTVSMEDPNRNEGVNNIPGSVNIPFFIETTITINPVMGCDNSPVITNPPINNGCVGELYVYNPGVYDPDGDSLSYILVPCRGQGGANILGFTEPIGFTAFYLNPVTGDLVWNTPRVNNANPEDTGEWNVAILILEWRKDPYGVFQNIGNVTLDMQITINKCNNDPPVIAPLRDTCVIAGSHVRYNVSASDINGDGITFSATGAPFQVSNPATFCQNYFTHTPINCIFNWNTICDNVRRLPYQVTFKAEDDDWHEHLPNPNYLVDFLSVNITVIAPAPKNLSAMPSGNTIHLNWQQETCPNAIGYKVYRRTSHYNDSIECPCTVGVPASTGFIFVGTAAGIATTSFVDNNNGMGLDHGIQYCYFVTAIFADSGESCASNQACAELTKDSPIITNVDILITASDSGRIYVAWSKPNQLDTVNGYRGPYQYKIYRSNDFFGSNIVLVDSTNTNAVLSFVDTTYIDSLHFPFNTLDNPWSYRIDLYSNDTLVNSSHVASSVYLTITSTDNRLDLSWEEHVGWTDTLYKIYRQELPPNQAVWDSIGVTTQHTFSDSGLENKVTRCYYVVSFGHYTGSGFVYPIIDSSERQCGTPIDNIPPCSPKTINANADCLMHQDLLVWSNPDNDCANDVIGYNIYYEATTTSGYELIATKNSATDTTYLFDNPKSIAGCFKVTALDSVGNESLNPIQVCVDNCPVYVIPNVFTPNGDGFNDLLHPFPYSYIRDINIQIFDRWGMIMYKTSNPDINWDGKNDFTNKDCPDGVYYYICKVNAIHYDGIRTFILKGFVELIREKK